MVVENSERSHVLGEAQEYRPEFQGLKRLVFPCKVLF
jgi:hypothetical protein